MITIRNSKPKARKIHKCNFCLQAIEKGIVYHNQVNIYDGELYEWKTHSKCSEVADKLKMFDDADEGVGSDDFWEHINNAIGILSEKLNLPINMGIQEKIDTIYNHY